VSSIAWSEDLVETWRDGVACAEPLRVARRCRLRVLSDRVRTRPLGVSCPAADFDAAIDRALTVWIRPWGSTSPLAQEAELRGVWLHVGDVVPGLAREIAVAQDDRGVWGPRSVTVATRRELRVVSDRSTQVVHRRGRGENFELVIDARDLGAWVRRSGSEAQLRRDEDGRGVSVIVLEDF